MTEFALNQARWVRCLVEALVAGGLRDVVISPGSRSTPLVLAFESLRREGSDVRLHPVIDERSAGFLALGIARGSGVAAALVCTSGTAAGHYLPAVMEAAETGVPMVVLTANRPKDLLGSGANQTTPQHALFGAHLRAFADLGEAGGEPRRLRAMARRGAWAMAVAQGERGPVHLDLGLRKPFEAVAGPVDSFLDATLPVVHPALPRVSDEALEIIAQKLRRSVRPLIVVGPARGGRGTKAWAELLDPFVDRGALVLPDVASGLRFAGERYLGGFDALLSSVQGCDALAPDLVIQLGDAPVGAGWLRAQSHWALGDGDAELVVLAEPTPNKVPDPESRASVIAFGDVEEALGRLARRWKPRGSRKGATKGLGQRQRLLREMLRSCREQALGAAATAVPGLTEAGVLRAAMSASKGELFLGNSLSVRLVDVWCGDADATVVHQRGVSGIDGLIAGAAGCVRATKRPSLLVLGDVSFQHDLGSLALLRDLPAPLVVLVTNNAGGRIFERLPVRKAVSPGCFEGLFAMDQGLDFEAAATAFGVAYRAPQSEAEVAEAVGEAFAEGGATILEVAVAKEAAEVARGLLSETLGQALESWGG